MMMLIPHLINAPLLILLVFADKFFTSISFYRKKDLIVRQIRFFEYDRPYR